MSFHAKTTSHALKKHHQAAAKSVGDGKARPPGIAKYSATAVATTGEESNGVGEARPPGTAKYMARAKSVLAEPPGELHEEASGTSSVDGLRAAFLARLLQRFLAHLAPVTGMRVRRRTPRSIPVNGMRVRRRTLGVTQWLSADGHLNCGCRAGSSADGS